MQVLYCAIRDPQTVKVLKLLVRLNLGRHGLSEETGSLGVEVRLAIAQAAQVVDSINGALAAVCQHRLSCLLADTVNQPEPLPDHQRVVANVVKSREFSQQWRHCALRNDQADREQGGGRWHGWNGMSVKLKARVRCSMSVTKRQK